MMAVLTSGLLMIAVVAILGLNMSRQRAVYQRADWMQAYYHAENVLNWAAQRIADADAGGTSAAFLGQYSVANTKITLPYLTELVATPSSLFKESWLTIQNDPSGLPDLYQVTSSAKVGDKIRTIRAQIRKNPPSLVFDYEYFLNNWGWWWGASITGQGDNRANWDFDFRGGPTINGSVIANGSITDNYNPIDPLHGPFPFHGWVHDHPLDYVHSGVPRIPMPNLQNFDYYKTKATNDQGQLLLGTNIVVNAVHRNAAKPGLYLDGTTNPITFKGPVVVDGDVVIKGQITGKGTLYVGGNLYIAGNLTYTNGPDFSIPPATMPAANRDNWVRDNTNKTLVAFGVRLAVLGGNPNTSEWKQRCFDPSSFGLKNVGDERNLGQDGIIHTPDDGVPYLDTNNDGIPDTAWYDADGDGVVDLNYNYDQQIFMTGNRAQLIYDYPVDDTGNPKSFDDCASNDINRIDGVYYCNHAVAMRCAGNNLVWNGSVISRDEAIVFNSTALFKYDPRIHSRYSNDPNRFIDLGLPVANRVAIQHMEEVAPEEGFHSL